MRVVRSEFHSVQAHLTLEKMHLLLVDLQIEDQLASCHQAVALLRVPRAQRKDHHK